MCLPDIYTPLSKKYLFRSFPLFCFIFFFFYWVAMCSKKTANPKWVGLQIFFFFGLQICELQAKILAFLLKPMILDLHGIPHLTSVSNSPKSIVLINLEYYGQYQWGGLSHGPYPSPPPHRQRRQSTRKQTNKNSLAYSFPLKRRCPDWKILFFFVNSSLALPFFLHKSVILYNLWTSFLSARWDGSLNKAN